MTPEETHLLRQVEDTYAQLDSWFHRTSTDVERPQKGSELDADDKPYPHAPISEMARMSLAIGTEHLRMVRIVTDMRQLFPTATFTALRGGLVGAAQAFWVLSNDSSEVRRSRGWTVLAEQLSELGKFYDEVNRIDPGAVDADQLAWHVQRTAQLAALRGERPPKQSQTEMIRLALESAFPNNPDRQRSGRLLWRMMSSDAHVLGWGLAQRASVQTMPSKGDPLAVLARIHRRTCGDHDGVVICGRQGEGAPGWPCGSVGLHDAVPVGPVGRVGWVRPRAVGCSRLSPVASMPSARASRSVGAG